MADAKQPHLNGAYYGPPIPPQQSYHRPGRGRGCGCGCCLLSLLFKIIITVVVVVGIAVLVLWLVFHPNKVKFHVVNASLTEFNLTGNTLSYNLALNMTVRNPNKKIGVYYDRIEARAFYDDVMFGSQTLTPFYQGHKNTTFLNPVFQGQSPLVLGTSELNDFNTDKTAASFDIDVKLYLRIRFKVGSLKTNKYKPKVKCEFKVPLVTNRSSVGGFETTRCDIDF
ncbi:PREDICTED: NDR1/HIN1-Like protein 3-like [Nelumbo nucifera]|uniref:NDR1/HIN1-Like protein 3-like n=2 Tax=Nelumbo nucifera TaxID=4432 RepID=A0A1U7Z791_NELNU|nr:PREDICTED: NDR1/HIN1-Like protein 3-like [Nelumbo nucifera]DAD48401.1 TPA_asm: hypothetical protein HUJ06_018338 [Nelumbo nucifera]